MRHKNQKEKQKKKLQLVCRIKDVFLRRNFLMKKRSVGRYFLFQKRYDFDLIFERIMTKLR